jgi:adenine-specific DNA-methyltransferase
MIVMAQQLPLFHEAVTQGATSGENPEYLTRQLLTYLGNKRSFAVPIEHSILEVRARLGGRRLRAVDLFSGSGFVSRLLKRHCSLVIANDLESYARAVSACYLSNADGALLAEAASHASRLNAAAAKGTRRPGFVSELYAPADDASIQPQERAFYTTDNARRLDLFVYEIQSLREPIRTLLLGPLLSKASIHVNTGGVFKGFYKDKHSGIGKFGAAAGNALQRILAPIELELPVLSRFRAEHVVLQQDANALAPHLADVDLAYIDPPYNQHPYGSNYFMLNLLTHNERPVTMSEVSGIPTTWNRSGYNVRRAALPLLEHLFASVPARFLLVSFNSEGFVAIDALCSALERHGRVDEIAVKYNTYRASRNLRRRDLHVREHLFLLDRMAR